jgi:hypothetical protein
MRLAPFQTKPTMTGIPTTGRLDLKFAACKRLRIVRSDTFTPAAVDNSRYRTRALIILWRNVKFITSLFCRCVVTLGLPDLALSVTESVAVNRFNSLVIVLGVTPNVPATRQTDWTTCSIPTARCLSFVLRERLLPMTINTTKVMNSGHIKNRNHAQMKLNKV